MSFKAILIIVLLIIVSILAAENLEFVDVRYYDFTFTSQKAHLPLCVVILVPLIMGVGLGWLLGWMGKMKLRGVIRRNEKTIYSLKEELERNKKPVLPEYKSPMQGGADDF